MRDITDLTERLAEAARDAVLARRAAIEAGVKNLGGVMVEIEVSNGGEVMNVNTHLSWKDVVRQAKRGAAA